MAHHLTSSFAAAIITTTTRGQHLTIVEARGSGVLLPEGCWSDSPGLHIEVSLGNTTETQTAAEVLVGTLHGSHHLQCMNACIIGRFEQKRLQNALKIQNMNTLPFCSAPVEEIRNHIHSS